MLPLTALLIMALAASSTQAWRIDFFFDDQYSSKGWIEYKKGQGTGNHVRTVLPTWSMYPPEAVLVIELDGCEVLFENKALTWQLPEGGCFRYRDPWETWKVKNCPKPRKCRGRRDEDDDGSDCESSGPD
ncbi:Uu.00g142900.m01.CDS01 [Anthostomella pinea]|uniref:Uu.00g142900.m01.CDS01 n=1 Tax=Anthostomella pinea TaxID=933095 RepID=A0AAI8VR79_9PEZI|nr:Uu.00g142900.m01.CDS01 [Anthostomella pinea]